MTKQIVIAERDNIAALIENNKVTEFFVNKGEIFLNDIYLATVDNILPSIEAAFVNVGSDKMGFLHADDVPGKGNLKTRLTPKQKLMVQVVKEPTGHKGPRVTTEISLPGRFLVLIPQETGINISRKITSSKERARLKSTVSLIKPVGIGVIVRTEAEGQSDAEIQEDLELLLEKWSSIIAAAETQDAPSLLYRDQDLLYRVIREACTEDISEIVLDTPFAMQRAQQILQNWNMLRNLKLTVYKGNEPMLQSYGIIKEIKAALQTKVMLPSGGYLFIQTTEALSVVDVNSGKFVSSATQDETIVKTNIEAAHEIARQLRLRNIGGMIIIDFIDMTSRNDKLAIMEEFELALENDKAKPQIGQLSDLGLVELTRHRQGQSLSEVFTKKCPHCQGTGMIFDESQFSSSFDDNDKNKISKNKLPIQQLKVKTTINHPAEPQEVKNENVVDRIEDIDETKTDTLEVQNENISVSENVSEVQVQQQNNQNNGFSNNNRNNHNKFNKNNRFNKKNRFNKFNRNNNFHNNEQPKSEQSSEPIDSVLQELKPLIHDEKVSVELKHENETEKTNLKQENNIKQEVKTVKENNDGEIQQKIQPEVEEKQNAPKKRGRKPKAETAAADATEDKPKKRGRKPKAVNVE